METAYLKCATQEGNRIDSRTVLVQQAGGRKSSGRVDNQYFNERNELKVDIAEELGGLTTVILPRGMSEDFITVESCLIAA